MVGRFLLKVTFIECDRRIEGFSIMRKHTAPGDRALALGIVILHEDRDILVVDKPAGLLTMGTEDDKERTAYYVIMDYVRKGQAKSRNRIFIVHRLDRETSGVLIFAKTEEAKMRLQEHWDETDKKYLAVVRGKMEESAGLYASYLAENSVHIVYSTPDTTRGKLARTAWRVLKENKEYTLLEVELLTGRKHQIRVHLADAGHPIVGDKKYGEKASEMRPGEKRAGGGGNRPGGARGRLALHARSITFNHPYSGERMTFMAKVPGAINMLMGGEPC